MRLVAIPAGEVDAVWHLVEEFVSSACRRGLGDDTPSSVFEECTTGTSQLWLVVSPARETKAFVVTQMVRQPTGRIACLIGLCGGQEMRTWLHLLKDIETAAASDGASSIRFLGRHGWARALPDYEIAQLVFEKDLRH